MTVDNKVNVNEEYFHGMSVLSIIAGNMPGQLVGTAPKAKFLLYHDKKVNIYVYTYPHKCG